MPDADQPAPPEERIRPDDWPAAIADADGAQILVAGPGTGKTEFLVRRAAHLIADQDISASTVLALTFSRRSAADLRKRISAQVDRSIGGLSASTFHSFAFRFLELHGPPALGWSEMPTILTGPEQVGLVTELLAASPPNDWPKPFRDILTTRTFAAEVTDFILRSRERLISTADLTDRAAQRDDWRALPKFIYEYDAALARLHRIDYGTLQATTATLLSDPPIRDTAANHYQYVLVDEYQDTTVAQATILKGLSSAHGNITVAADPYQSIYSFRGAELSNVAEFPRQFADQNGEPARRRVLTTSFRVPAEILRAAERVTTGGALPGSAGPVDPARHTGRDTE
jgi:superfamily I DNA/RNA helicase